jgi:hypothetical protein
MKIGLMLEISWTFDVNGILFMKKKSCNFIIFFHKISWNYEKNHEKIIYENFHELYANFHEIPWPFIKFFMKLHKTLYDFSYMKFFMKFMKFNDKFHHFTEWFSPIGLWTNGIMLNVPSPATGSRSLYAGTSYYTV